MDRNKNNSSYKKDMSGVKKTTEKMNSFRKGQSGMTSASTTKKSSLSFSSNNYREFHEKPKPDRTPSAALYKKKDQNLIKPASQSVTSYNNIKQQPTKNEYKIVKPKQDQIQLGVSYKGDQSQSKVLNSFSNNKVQKPSYNDFSTSKSKQDGEKKSEPNLTKTSTFAAQSRGDQKHVNELKTLNHSQDNKNNEKKRDKLIADYATNIALVRTMKHMWQSPRKGKDANPMKSLSYVASDPKNLKYKPDERVNSNFGAHSFWEEQGTSKVKNSVPENFLIGQSKPDVKLNDRAAEAIGTETFKSNQSFQNAKLKAENQEEIKEEELQKYLLKEPALTALYIGLPADLIKRAIKEKLKQTGAAFISTRELMEAVSKLKKESQETPKLTLQKLVPKASTEAELNVFGQEEEKFEDRKMLEEIKLLKQEKTCKICLDAQVGIVFVPCGHLVACVKCSENIKTCPLCRVEIQSAVKTFLS